MEKKPSIAIASLGYGVIIALAIIVFSLILFLLNLSKGGGGLQYLTYLILFGGILFAQMNYRKKYLDGYITYGKAFMLGMLTSLFLAIIMGIYTYVFFKFIDPGAMEEGMVMAEQQMMDRGMTDMEIEQGMEWARKFQSPGMFTFFAVAGNFIIGMVISLITAAFVKREGTDYGQPAV